MSEEEIEKSLTLDKKTIDVLVAQVIPTSKYFEVRFDHMQDQINGLRYDLKEFKGDVSKGFDSVDKRFDAMKADMDQRFTQVGKRFDAMKADMDQRFTQVDKRFDAMNADMDQRFTQVDKRFDAMKADMDQRFAQVDKRFDAMNADMNQRFTQMIAAIDRLTDKLDYRDEKQRSFTLRMFTISISISVAGVFGVFLKIFGVF